MSVIESRIPRPTLSPGLLLVMAVACGLCVGGNYFNQPLLDSIAGALGVEQSTAAVTVTLSQVFYGLGLLFLVPLGDLVDRRRLSVGLMVLAALGQGVCGFAPSIGWLMIGTATAGLFSVAAQVLVPFAAALAEPGRAATAVGTVMSGLMVGILLARSVAGLLTPLGGWQTVYRVSAVAMLLIAALLWRALPTSRDDHGLGYGAILASMGTLLRQHPRLRTATAMSALSFAAASTVFAAMAFVLAAPPFGLDDVAIGFVGLAGVAGAVMANVAGRLADRGFARATAGVGAAVLIASWALFGLGASSLIAFVLAVLISDVALKCVHVSNQGVIYALAPQARSRVTAVYMTGYFVGGAAGSALGSLLWATHGWVGVCWAGVGLSVAVLVVWWLDLRISARTSTPVGAC
ncbi:MFS transporter [Prescottella equi]|uniref:Transporter n=1 Tax=Rhodococcus hoagii TaxID=43767 RepID=A0AAE5IR24_RHOHA|nr:MFS transporter [Prescottella equi]ERN45971.1 mfs transporter [Prescottella equi NBRC 101255 = C 7]MBM4626293.1 MFS transporter [Prescottella equi]NKZ78595.1 MFS transporter [Prescottella equi]ORL25870.1 transporter [Prescottella equi]ORL99616.1 transporter [Prescottella equi]